MTDMMRCTISFPDDLEKAIRAYQESAEKRITYSEAVRRLVEIGLRHIPPAEKEDVNK